MILSKRERELREIAKTTEKITPKADCVCPTCGRPASTEKITIIDHDGSREEIWTRCNAARRKRPGMPRFQAPQGCPIIKEVNMPANTLPKDSLTIDECNRLKRTQSLESLSNAVGCSKATACRITKGCSVNAEFVEKARLKAKKAPSIQDMAWAVLSIAYSGIPEEQWATDSRITMALECLRVGLDEARAKLSVAR